MGDISSQNTQQMSVVGFTGTILGRVVTGHLYSLLVIVLQGGRELLNRTLLRHCEEVS